MSAVGLLNLRGRPRTPVIQQSEASECGLACLAMVAGFHGFQTDMPALRRRFAISIKGATLKVLMDIAEQIGLGARPLRGEPDDLTQLALPAILHWKLSHFVVLTRIRGGMPGRRRYLIHDPALGARWVEETELSRNFSGIVLELTPTERFRPQVERAPLRISQLWSRMTGLASALRNVLLLSIILQLAALAMPFYLQIAVDTIFPSFDSDLLTMLAVGFGGLVLINMLVGWLRSLILLSAGSALSYQIVSNLNRHLLRLPLQWFEKRHVGDVISRFGSTKPIANLVSQGMVASVIDGLMSILTLVLMFVYSPLLAGIAVAALLLVVALRFGFLGMLKARNVDVVTTAARENSTFIESVRGIAAVKAFGQEVNRQRLWQQHKADAVNAEIKLGRITAGFAAVEQFILGIERVIFVYLAIRLAMSGDFTVGMIFAFQIYKSQFLDAGTKLVEQFISFKLLDVHLGRIADIALSPAEPAGGLGPFQAEPVVGAIELRGVRFRYGAGEPEILRGVNLKVEAGSMVAIVGPSGGGKTTLMKVMMGLLQPSYGQILVDGKPLAALGLDAWRRQIGSVAQDDLLYAGTLAENIAFFDPEISMERVTEVAKIACIHDEIMRMPLQYETLVGDMGSALSGGQQQRILLARAIYHKPRVLFMDEGTANLDAPTEAKIVAALEHLGITRIVIAHRPQAIKSSRRVYLVVDGCAREVVSEDKPAAATPVLEAAVG